MQYSTYNFFKEDFKIVTITATLICRRNTKHDCTLYKIMNITWSLHSLSTLRNRLNDKRGFTAIII